MHEINNYGAPKNLDFDAAKHLGQFQKKVAGFIDQLNGLSWLVLAGRQDSTIPHVIRVFTVEEANTQYRRLLPLTNAVYIALGTFAEKIGRDEIIQAAEDYWIARFDPKFGDVDTLEGSLWAPAMSQMVGALRELVLDDAVSIHYFREAVYWYRLGHFLCGIDESGKRVVW